MIIGSYSYEPSSSASVDVEPISLYKSVVIHLNQNFTLEDPIIFFTMCHKYVFGLLAVVPLPSLYGGEWVWGLSEMSMRVVWERRGDGKLNSQGS